MKKRSTSNVKHETTLNERKSKTFDLSYFHNQQNCFVADEDLAVRLPESGILEMPIIKKQNIDLCKIDYLPYQSTIYPDNRLQTNQKTVRFFVEDRRFAPLLKRPWLYTERLSQYKQILSPDVSCYTDMSEDDQKVNTFFNRVIGVFWQFCGMVVIPTITWSNERSYPFAFDGVEKGSIVAVSTIGTKNNYSLFMAGYRELCNRISPTAVICYCSPYHEMSNYSEVIYIEYAGREAKRKAKYKPVRNQISIFDYSNTKEVV
jgi:hypothetical protein